MSALDNGTARRIEARVSDVTSELTAVSNELYAADPSHPFLDELSSAIATLEYLPTEQLYESDPPVQEESK